jgi:hypothetical protein
MRSEDLTCLRFFCSQIDDFPHAELVEQDVRAIFTAEPVSSRA